MSQHHRSRQRAARLRVEHLEDRTTPANLPTGFTEQFIADGITRGTAMEFAPNGDLWVLEQDGAVKRFRAGNATPDLVANLSVLGLRSEGERGVLGIAFDPSFATNKFVYFYYTSSDAPNPHNRVSRFTVDDANPNDYSLVDTVGNPAVLDEAEILNLDPLSGATNHNGGAIHFGPDGKLYVAVGDNANGNNSQSITTRLGKILRINADGTIPGDNPTTFPGIGGTTAGANQAIWAVGLRNPYTFTFQPGTGRLHINDVGENSFEEVNLGAAGRNYGWPGTEGFFNPATFPNYTNPIYAYGHGSGPFQGFAITGGAFYNPTTSQFPATYAGDYFFADFVNDWINVMNSDGTDVRQFATAAPGVVDLRVLNDGSLYYLARDSGRVYRVNYQTDQAPVVTQQPVSTSAAAGGTVSFSVTAAGTAPLSYQWQKNGSNLANGSGVSGATTPTLTLTGITAGSAGQYRVVVTDAAGTATSDPATLTVTAAPGPVTIVDDGDAGYSAAAGWQRASGAGFEQYFGGDTGFVDGRANVGPASWTASLPAGTYRVSTTWTGFSNRSTTAQYSVVDGSSMVLASKTVNQRANPDDFSAAGALWEDVGTVTISSAGALTVRLAGTGNGALIADAVRVEQVPPPPPPGPTTIVDDGDAGYSAPGWSRATGAGFEQYFGGDTGFVDGTAGAGPASWTASLPAGSYRVSATWTGFSNRATNAVYSVVDGSSTVLASKTVNQRANPDDFSAGGTLWEDIGVVTISSAGALTVRLAGAGNGALIADAIRFEQVPPPPPPTVTIVDDGDPGYAAAGWQRASGAGFEQYFGGDTGFVDGQTNVSPATWTAFSLPAGTYRVSATWTGFSNRSTTAQYAVFDGSGNTLASQTFNQRTDPGDFVANGAMWEDIGTVTTSSAGNLLVRLLGTGNGALIADAVRFEKIA